MAVIVDSTLVPDIGSPFAVGYDYLPRDVLSPFVDPIGTDNFVQMTPSEIFEGRLTYLNGYTITHNPHFGDVHSVNLTVRGAARDTLEHPSNYLEDERVGELLYSILLADGSLYNVKIRFTDGEGPSMRDFLNGDVNIEEYLDLVTQWNDVSFLNGEPEVFDYDGGAGADFNIGSNNPDSMEGNDGFDTLIGSGGQDTLRGGHKQDSLSGGNGDDDLFGGRGQDLLFGDNDDDFLRGNGRDDYLEGGFGNDTLSGNRHNDTILGQSGSDRMFGGGDNDYMDGGLGEDTLVGGTGDDRMLGGLEADMFVFRPGHDNDTITDFDVAEDQLRIDSRLVLSGVARDSVLEAATDTIIDGINGTLIDFGDGDTIFLEGVSTTDLAVADIEYL